MIFNAAQVDIDPATGRALADRADPAAPRGLSAVTDAADARRHDPLPPGGRRRRPSADHGRPAHAHDPSDGVLEPAALVAAGVRRPASGLLAITDHDTLAGYRELVGGGCGPAGDSSSSRASRSTRSSPRDLGLWEGELHILGLGVDPDDDGFEAALADQRDARRVRFAAHRRAAARRSACSIDAQVAALDGDRRTTRSAGRASPGP